MGLECGWRHAQMVLWIWGFWKDVSGVFDRWRRQLSFLTLSRVIELCRSLPTENLNSTIYCRTLGGGSTLYGYQRLLRIVSLSSCPKPEINKPVLIWNERARLCLYMYSITIITDIIKKYATKRRLKRY